MSTPRKVAEWMAAELEAQKLLYQETVAHEIEARFGETFVYINANGNLAVDRKVLLEFRNLTADDVVWDRSERLWRKRESFDTPGKRQAD